MKRHLFSLLLLYSFELCAQVEISKCHFVSLIYPNNILTAYILKNHTQEAIYSWICEKNDFSEEMEVRHHFVRRKGDFNLFNLMYDVEDYESLVSDTTTGNLIVKLMPKESFVYVFCDCNSFLTEKIAIYGEAFVEQVIQAKIPQRLLFKGRCFVHSP